jgi:xylulose-5-phosphate/fructose-6-phosphate phosphoketolase
MNYLPTFHVWRQDHNGFSHQDPGFADFVANKKADIVRLYFPPDANTLLWVTDHCLMTRNRINVVTASKQPQLQWLPAERPNATVWRVPGSGSGPALAEGARTLTW